MATFSGGEKFEAALKAMAAKLEKGGNLRVGFLEESTYPDGTSVPMIAALQEYGKKGTPPRPFFRSMIAKNSAEWPDALAGLLQANNYDPKKALAQMGAGIAGQLQVSITETNSPALSTLTLMIRKWKADNPNQSVTGTIVGQLAAKMHEGSPDISGVSTKPLVDSGVMFQAVAYDVKD